MKCLALLGLLLSALSMQAQTSIIPISVIPTNGQFVAYWYCPPYINRTNNIYAQTNATMWLTEVSTDGITWTGMGSENIYLPSREVRALNQSCLTCLHVVDVPNATDRVRIRLVSY